MRNVAFIVDGFNVYHSLKAAEEGLGGTGVRWLDLRGLLDEYVRTAIGGGAQLLSVDYFSARPTHLESRKPGIVARQDLYLRALESTGVNITLGKFAKGRHFCATCSSSTKRYEEKETDVAMAARLFELLADADVDVAVMVSGDTDLVPAIRTALKMHPAKPIWSGFPYRRENKELRATATQSFTIRKERYRAHQLPSPVVLGNGRELDAPQGWT